MIRKTTQLGSLFFAFLIVPLLYVSGQSINYQFAPNSSSCADNSYCVNIQLEGVGGAEYLGSGSIRLSYDNSVLAFAGSNVNGGTGATTGSYTSINFDDDQDTLNPECETANGGQGGTPYSTHSYDGNVPGEVLITVVLDLPTTFQTFACPSVAGAYVDVSTICFDVLDFFGDPNLAFVGTENGIPEDESGSNFNDDTDIPENKYANGSLGTLNTTFDEVCGVTTNPVCGSLFTDSGGEDGQYMNNESDTMVFCPDNVGEIVQVAFNEDAQIEATSGTGSDGTGCWDYLAVYEGEGTGGNFLGNYCSDTVGPNFDIAGAVFTSNAADGCLTFIFNSDVSTTQDGWAATVSCLTAIVEGCTDPIAENYNPNANVDDGSCEYIFGCTDETASNYNPDATQDDGSCEYSSSCGGVFLDDGGVDGEYGLNLQDTTIICPEVSGDVVQVTFNEDAAIEGSGGTGSNGTGCWDYLSVYDGGSTDGTFLGDYCSDDSAPNGNINGASFTSTSDDGCLTFVFFSDGFIVQDGWNASITCLSDVVFGCTDPIAENYDAAATVDDGSCAYIDGCTDELASNYNPDATQDDGSCEYLPVCGGAYFDAGGPDGDYLASSDETITICPDNANELVQVTFTEFLVEGLGAGDCWDELFIYDSDTADPAAIISSGGASTDGWCFESATDGTAAPGEIVASNPTGCLTFVFQSDGSVQLSGWAASVACVDAGAVVFGCTDPVAENYDPAATNDDGSCEYILGCTDPTAANYDEAATQDDGSCVPGCGSIFTDTGGEDGLYNPDESNSAVTICPDPGTILVVNFSDFIVEDGSADGCWDDLQIIYGTDADGNGGTPAPGGQDETSGGFCGDDITALPNQGVVTSGNFDECITFLFSSDGFVQQDGWVAMIDCQTELDIAGCTDPAAFNYNPAANSDDGSCIYGPANDDCAMATAIDLVAGSNNGPYSNEFTTAENDGIFDPACFFIGDAYQTTVYFSFVGDGNLYQITSNNDCGGDNPLTDTQFALFDGSCDGALLACDDDSGDGLLSSILLETEAGVTYYLLVDGYNGNFGDFCINIEGVSRPENDECVDAIDLALGDGLAYGPFTNEFASTSEGDVSLGCFFGEDPYQATVFFSFVGDGNGYVINSSTDCDGVEIANNDTQFSLFEGSCDGPEIACDDDSGEGLLSEVVFQTEEGVTYYLLVDGWNGTEGQFCLNMAQAVVGCTNPQALNYNADATADDGSCIFPCDANLIFVSGTPATGFDITGIPFVSCPSDWGALNSADPLAFVAVAPIDGPDNAPYTLTVAGAAVYEIVGGGEPPMLVDELELNDGFIGLIGITPADLAGGPITVTITSSNNPDCSAELLIDASQIGDIAALCPESFPPANDECPDAIGLSVGDGVVNGPYSNQFATTTEGAVTPDCFFGEDVYQNTVYFSFEGDGEEYTITSINCDGVELLNGDTQFALFEGSCDGPEIACDDDGGPGLLSQITVATTAGTTYYLLVDGWSGSQGEFCIAFQSGAPPANDECEDAIEVVEGLNGPFSNAGASTSTEGDVTPGCFFIDDPYQNTVYYTFVGDGSDYLISTSTGCGGIISGNFDTQMAVFEGACDGPEIACDDDSGTGLLSEVSISTVAGTTYYILVDGFAGSEGQYCIAVQKDEAPENDECVQATPIVLADGASNGPFTNLFSTLSTEPAVTGGCFFAEDAYQNTVYFSFEGDGNAYSIFSDIGCEGILSPNGDTQFALFEGSCDGPEIACDDDSGAGLLSQITVQTEVGTTYYLLVDGFNGTQGDFCLNVTQVFIPDNDECVDAISLTVGDGVFNGPFTNESATASEDSPPPSCFIDVSLDNTVYFTFVGDGNPYLISGDISCSGISAEPLTDSQMALYEGSCDGPEVACDDDSGPLFLSQLVINTEAGVTYYLLLDGFGGDQGDFCILFEEVTVGCTDPFADNFDPDAEEEDGSCLYSVACGETFTDPGGALNNYEDNTDIVWTICPDNPEAGEVALVEFTEFDVENGFDFLNFFDGTSVTAPFIVSLTGNQIPNPVFATNETGCLTAQFSSDFIFNNPGWVASVSCPDDLLPGCTDPTAFNYDATANIEDGSCYFADCGGTFTDTGGPDGPYDVDENYFVTYCSDTEGESVVLSFTEFSTEAGFDGIIIYDGNNENAPVLGVFTGTLEPFEVFPSGNNETGCLTIEVISDFIITDDGWVADISCGSFVYGCTNELADNFDPSAELDDGSCVYTPVPGGVFVDEGGPDEVYPGAFTSPDTTIICPETLGQTLVITFSQFEVEPGAADGCWDNLEIWEDVDGDQQITEADMQVMGGQDGTTGGFCGLSVEDLPNGGVITSMGAGNCLIFILTGEDDFDNGDQGWLATIEVEAALCEAEAGTLTGLADGGAYESGEDVVLGVSGNNTSSNYITLYLATQGEDYTIASLSTNGTFSNLSDGSYQVHVLNALITTFSEIQMAFPTGLIGESAIDVLGALSDMACYELNEGNDPSLGAAFSVGASDCNLLITIFEDDCDENSSFHDVVFEFVNGSGQYNLSINGGDPVFYEGDIFSDGIAGSPETAYMIELTDLESGCTAIYMDTFGDCTKGCDAEAGSLTGVAAGGSYCTGQSVVVGSEGFLTAGGLFVQTHILTQDDIVVAIAADGNFGELAAGTYCIYQYNYVTEDGIEPVIGDNIAVFLTGIFDFCFDIGDENGDCTEITIEDSPISITFDDQCDENTNVHSVTFLFEGGSGEYAVSVNGGSFESLGGNTFYFDDIAASSNVYSLIVQDELNGCTAALDTLFEDCVKACDANAGNITIAEDSFCEGDVLTGVGASDYQMLALFTQVYVLTSQDSDEIVAMSESGDFGVQAPGVYCAYALNYVTEDGAPVMLGDGLSDAITSLDANICLDIDLDNCNQIVVFATPNPNPSSNSPVCAAQTILLTAADGFEAYTWSGPNGFSSNEQNPEASDAGTYTVTVTDINGCEGSASTEVEISESLEVSIIPSEIAVCQGESVDFSSSLMGTNYTYSWSATAGSFDDDTSAEPTYTMMMPGTYDISLEVMDELGCTAMALASVTINANPTEDDPELIEVCEEDTPYILTAPDAYTYSWANGSNDQTLEVNASGSYELSITDENGCSQDLVYEVIVNPSPVIPDPDPITVCADDLPVILEGPDGYEYLWSNGSDGQTLDVSFTGIYELIIEDENGCTALLTYVVNIVDGPNEEQPNMIGVCEDAVPVTLMAPEGYTYQWSDGNTDATLEVSTSGTYALTITDANGCSQELTYEVTVFSGSDEPAPETIEVCEEDTPYTLTAPDGYLYTWSNGSNSQSIEVGASGMYSVDITNDDGCSQTLTYDIVVNEGPEEDQPEAVVLCSDDAPYTMAAPDGYTYVWFDGTTDQTNVADESGSYSVVITDDNGCTQELIYDVTINETPVVDAPAPVTVCQGAAIGLEAPSGFTYLWFDGSTNQTVVVTETGVYAVTLIDENGCDVTIEYVVTFEEAPNESQPDPVVVCAPETSATLTAPVGYTYLWDKGSTSQSIEVTEPGVSSVTITNVAGCTQVLTYIVSFGGPDEPQPAPIIVCEGSSVELIAPDGYAYLWFDGSTEQTITVTGAGTYTVTIGDAAECSQDLMYEIIESGAAPNEPQSGGETICTGTSTTLMAPDGYTYLWNTGETTQSISAIGGTYTVVISNECGSQELWSNREWCRTK